MEKNGRIRKEEKSIKQQLNPESGFTLERGRERELHLLKSKKTETKTKINKKYVIILAMVILVGMFALVITNTSIREGMLTYAKKLGEAVTGANISENNGTSSQADGETNENARALTIGDKAIISSVAISDRATGTAPWDDDNEPGNDMDAENNIVRSFDQVTWTTELTFAIKEGAEVDSLTGGTIEFEVTLPEECSNVMEWDLNSMVWVVDGVLSEDGRTLRGKYVMSEEQQTVPGKQTLVFVLQVYGASNETKIEPTFAFSLTGNEDNEVITKTAEEVIVSSTAKYNIQLHSNTGSLSDKITVDYGQGETSGRMYGYGFTVQLYNESESKGIKGLEYPQGEISFDIDLKLERTEFGSSNREDITEEATPILWNYRVNNWDTTDRSGNIEGRDMYYVSGSAEKLYDSNLPQGIDTGERYYSTYNSGDIYIEQNGSILHVTIKNYDFDEEFPMYSSSWPGSSIDNKTKIYTENVGTFSVGYMQIFVPDTEASTIESRNYYLTVSDNNMSIISSTGETINNQMKTSDDNLEIQHVLYKQGTYYHLIHIYNKNGTYGSVETSQGTGDGRVNIGDTIRILAKFMVTSTNDYDIYTANRFVKFDGEAYEPVYYDDGSKYKTRNMNGNAEFKVWYVTKKDGTNWTSQEEMNNGNIEDMEIYETIEEIPEDKICIGIYFETISGYLARSSGNNNSLIFLLKIKDTAEIGKTYGMTQRTWYWLEELDRSVYTITNKDIKYLEDWTDTEWDSGNKNYIKTEYDENGQMVVGTHSGGASWGNTVLVVGANLYGNIRAVDSSNADKVNYDLGKNENIVTYSLEPELDANENLTSQIENVTLKAEVTLPDGLTYVAGSSTRGGERYAESVVTENEDGSTTIVWYIYGVTSGQEIEPILFDAQISNNSSNNTQYEATFVVSEEIGEDGISKIGNSEISFRTSSTTINIIKLSNYRLYKETDTPIIEANGEITYRVIYQNNTDTSVPDFQILDILPYNGDGRGSSFNGTYTLKSVKVTQIDGDGEEVALDNLSLYTTTSPDARRISPKDESIGISEIWSKKEIGEDINEAVIVLALKGEIGRNTEIQIEITIQTTNNRGGDTYYNQATAQISKESEVITTTNIKAEVVARQISGKIWYDTNENGVIDADEAYASRIEVELLKADGSKAVDYNGNEITNILTDSNGEYSFNNLPMGEYIVEIKTEDRYTLTEANVGTNREINSKFEEREGGAKQSYTITNLNGIQSPEIIEANVNAGLVVKDAKIIVKYLEEDNTPETDEDNTVLKEQDEITTYDKEGVSTKYKIGDNYSTEPAEIADYIILRNSGNTSGTINSEETVVTYYYAYNKQNIEVTKVWEDNGNEAEKRPYSIKVSLKEGENVIEEVVLTEANEVTDAEIEGISSTAEVWQATIEDVAIYDENGQRIEYTIDESENEGTLESYIKTINGMTITNTFTQNTEKINIPVTKVWNDNDNRAGKRPESLTLVLKREVSNSLAESDSNTYVEVARATINGIDNQGANSNEWAYTFTGISKYDENNDEIKYIVEEIVPNFYTSTVESVENVVGEGTENGFRITNTFEVPDEQISYEVTKVWNDNNNRAGKRPEEVTLVLTGKNQQGEVVVEPQRITLTKTDAIDGNTEGTTDTSTTWKGTISNLPRYDENADLITYELSEESLNNIFYTEVNTTINQETKTVTNKFEVPDEQIAIEVTKVWDDNNNAEGERPESVTLYLTGNGQESEITLTKANAIDGNTEGTTDTSTTWRGTISNLPKYDVNGNEINYILDERPVASEFYTKTNVEQESKTVTNRFAIPTENIQITVTKIWEDNENELGKRPENITLQIINKATGEIVASQLVQGSSTSNEGWSYTFEVPKYAGSTDEVEYEIGEADLNNIFYTNENAEINQETRTITNRFEIPDERIEITVTKIWVEEVEDGRKARPEEIIIEVIDEAGKVVKEEPMTEENQIEDNADIWQTTIEVAKYNEQAEEKTYTIDEKEAEELENYEKKIEGTTITNTYIGPVIEAEKEVTTENNLNYVVEGEKITYTIRVENSGKLAGDILVKDSIPAGTSFVAGSIKVNDEEQEKMTADDLANGITVTVPARSEATAGEVTVSFEVTVNELEGDTLTETIRNIATINKDPDDPESEDEPTNETETTVNKSNLQYNKTSNPASGNTVKEGDEITYTIHLDNTTGTAPISVVVKDEIPEGTTFVAGSIKVGDEAQEGLNATDLSNGINVDLEAGESKDVEFKVTVNDLSNGDKITNIATIDKDPDDPTNEEENTNETEHTYIEPVINAEKEVATEMGLSYVVEGEKITYTIRVQNSGDLAGDVVVKDNIPDGTTFVEGSIKIDGVTDDTKTAEDLANGITVNVPARSEATGGANQGEEATETIPGEVTVSFEVTVNELEGEVLTATIRNVATINKDPDDPESEDEPTNETETTVNKSNLQYNKTSNPASGNTVKEGDEITYTIHLDNTTGTAPISVVVKDEIPEGTTFVDGSIRVNSEAQEGLNATNLANGINVDLEAGESKDIEFKVTVNDLDNGDEIRNIATIDNYPDDPTNAEESTNETEHTYIEPVIDANKEVATEMGLSYVVEGEKITYTINVENRGDLAGNVIVKDSIPAGTTFVAGSIKVNGTQDASKTADDLAQGITVYVPARESDEIPGEGRVSFDVIVDEVGENETSKTIRNTAYINKNPEDPDEPTNEVSVPVLIYNKKAEIIRIADEDIEEGAVTAGDRIKYTITINNVGDEAIEDVKIKDKVPEGTTIYQINDNGEISLNDANIITWNIDRIEATEEVEVSFEVTVNYDTEEKTITNVGTVDGKETNKVETPYKVPELVLESSIVKDGTNRITNTDEKISYAINYKAEIRGFVGKGSIQIVDYLPYEIEEENSELNGGTYNSEDKTITWEEDLNNIDTYINEEGITTIEKIKTITLKYIYPDEENLSGTIENRVEGTISLTQEQEVEDPSNPDGTVTEDVVVREETKEDNHEVDVEIPAKVIVHHYIYDEAQGGETTEEVPATDGGVVADETINGYVGNEYKTSPSDKINANYECVETEPENYEGTMNKTDIEVTYYYKLKEAEIGAEIEKTAEASRGNVLTQEDGVVAYSIVYKPEITNYQGRARITIVDKLPADIDINDARVDLDGGTYNKEDKTITWTEEIEVDTFTVGEMYNETIEKEIQVVYKEQNVLETLINEVTGTVTIYYPENHTTDPGEERDTNTVTDTAEVEQEYKVIKEVEKVWDDNNDVKGNRPESVTVQLTANGNTNYNGEALEKVVLSNSNNWSYTFTDLPKYDGLGKEIEYSVVETETNAGDLEYYDTPVIIAETDTIVVTNKYRLMNTDIQSSINKTGTEKITSTKEKVTYNINYKVAITDYIGEAVIKVVDTLPYAIDEASSNLNGGTYDEATKTITWEERIEHINTYTDGTYEVEISKEVTLVYENIDATQREMTNQVRGTIDLYETEQTNTVEDTHDTAIEIPGNVIVKYVDRETGEEITEGYEIEGLVGETYTTEQKEIPAYTYIGNSGNTEGNIIEGTIKVTYYYEREAAGGVHVIYVDEEGNKIAEDENYEGKVGDPYETEEKDIYGYEYVRVEGEPEGEMTEDEIEVVYVYKKLPARVIVRYLEKDETPEDDSDNRVLYPEETIEGLVGDSYTTNRKEIENYQVAEPEPENKEGNMTEEDIYVTYYYEKIPSGKVIAQYVDIDTNEEILYKDEETGEYKTYREESQGYVEEEYTTEEKEIPYYKLIEELMPANKEGKYTEEDIYVTYYYEKLEFNIGIDKNVEEILINGEEQKVLDGKLNKVEVVGSRINSTEVKITYSIIVRNTGELGGTAVIEENIPKNFELNEETGEEWEETEDGSLEAEVELEAGETKELKVVLNWIKGNNRFGIQKNTVRIVETNNPAGYEETTTEDNTSSSEVVMGVKTGSEISEVAIIISLTGMIICVLVFIYISDKYIKEYKEKNGMIK